jgi:hypothetical protein
LSRGTDNGGFSNFRNDTGADGRTNPSFLAPPSTPGEFGSFIYPYGPRFVSDDVSIAKQMPVIVDWLRVEICAEMVNAFNHPIFQVPTDANRAQLQSRSSTCRRAGSDGDRRQLH